MMAVVLILSFMPRVHPIKKKWWWKKLIKKGAKREGFPKNEGGKRAHRVFQGGVGMRDEWRRNMRGVIQALEARRCFFAHYARHAACHHNSPDTQVEMKETDKQATMEGFARGGGKSTHHVVHGGRGSGTRREGIPICGGRAHHAWQGGRQ